MFTYLQAIYKFRSGVELVIPAKTVYCRCQKREHMHQIVEYGIHSLTKD